MGQGGEYARGDQPRLAVGQDPGLESGTVN